MSETTEQVDEVVEQEAQQAPVTEAPKVEPAKVPAWAQKRIDTMARQRGEAERRAELAERRASEAEVLLRRFAEATPGEDGKPIIPPQEAPTVTPEIFQAKVEEAAAIREFNRVCNDIYNTGSKEYTDFPDRVAVAQSAGVLNPALVEAAMELGDAHKIIYALTDDLDAAAKIAELPPIRMAAALARFAMKPEKKITSAPPPITPVSGAASPSFDPEKASTAEWMEWRKKQVAEKGRR